MNDSHRENNWRGSGSKTQAEKLLLSLRDIVGAAISISPAGDVTEISILAEGHRPPKQIVRDVRSALRAEYQLDLDYRKVSVAQKSLQRDRVAGGNRTAAAPAVESPPEPTPTVLSLPAARVQEEPALGRLRFTGVSTHVNDMRCEVRVELSLGDRDAQGEAVGANAKGQLPRLVAEATLDAVSRFLDDSCQLALGDLEVLRFSGEEVALVGVKFYKDRSEKALTGSCAVGHDLPQSMVYATLDALNRILGRLRYKEPVEFELRPTTIS